MSFHKLPTKHIDQLSLNVSNLDQSITFYREMLGMKLLEQSDRQAVFTFDGKNPILTIEQPNDVKPLDRRKTGLFHVAYLVPTRADLANVVYHFWRNQLPVQGASDHRVSEALYLADPDGNGIEIYRDRDPEEWKWQGNEVVMDTIPLDIQGLLKERTEEGWDGFTSDSMIGHIHLQVDDLKDVQPFYEKLGFDVVAKYGPQALFMSDNRYHHHIGLNVWNSRGGTKRDDHEVGLNWYSIKMTEGDRHHVKESFGEQVQDTEAGYFLEDPAGITIRI